MLEPGIIYQFIANREAATVADLADLWSVAFGSVSRNCDAAR